jgi:hypothetical protein
MSQQEMRTARSKKAGARRMHNLDIAEKAEEHGMHSAEDVHRAMTELKGKIAFQQEMIEEWDDMQDEAAEEHAMWKERRKTAEAAAKASEEAKKNYEQKQQQLEVEMNRKLEGKRKELEGKRGELEQLGAEIKKKLEQKLEKLSAEMEKKLEGKRRELTEKEQALTEKGEREMERHALGNALTEDVEIRGRILARAEARAEEKDATNH